MRASYGAEGRIPLSAEKKAGGGSDGKSAAAVHATGKRPALVVKDDLAPVRFSPMRRQCGESGSRGGGGRGRLSAVKRRKAQAVCGRRPLGERREDDRRLCADGGRQKVRVRDGRKIRRLCVIGYQNGKDTVADANKVCDDFRVFDFYLFVF